MRMQPLQNSQKWNIFHLHYPNPFTRNGHLVLKSLDYNDDGEQIGWSKDHIIGGANSCPFICTICQGLPKFPTEIQACGDIFCYDCIKLVLNKSNEKFGKGTAKCPNCSIIFKSAQIASIWQESRALLRVFTAIDVRCDYGCGHVCSTVSMIEHEMWYCRKRPVACPNTGCDFHMADDEMDIHVEQCLHRLVFCERCHVPKPVTESNHDCIKALSGTINCKLLSFIRYLYIVNFLNPH